MEKTLTFNVTDALLSPLGLAMLTGAGIADATEDDIKHIHVTMDGTTNASGVVEFTYAELAEELGIPQEQGGVIKVCADSNIKTYATKLDHNGAITGWVDTVTVTKDTAKADKSANVTFTLGTTSVPVASTKVKVDFYVIMKSGLTQITIAPDSFGGTYYVEADTLYRNQDGKDMAATLTFPKVKIQSGFTISMAPTGDPSTFDFVMDAMPGYTYFDGSKKVVCDISIVGGEGTADSQPVHSGTKHSFQ